MKLGSLHQKANWFLVGFVFGCITIITVLLIFLQKYTEVGLELSYEKGYESYYTE
jgi:hypothetical protein